MTTSLDQRPVFLDLASPLPPERAAESVGYWDIGEQEAAIASLVDELVAAEVRVTARQRARLAAVAESWGQWELVADRVTGLRAAPGDESYGELVEGRAVSAVPEGLPDGFEPVEWARCGRCAGILVRLYERQPWGIVPPADAYAVIRPPDIQSYDDPLAAFEALAVCRGER